MLIVIVNVCFTVNQIVDREDDLSRTRFVMMEEIMMEMVLVTVQTVIVVVRFHVMNQSEEVEQLQKIAEMVWMIMGMAR